MEIHWNIQENRDSVKAIKKCVVPYLPLYFPLSFPPALSLDPGKNRPDDPGPGGFSEQKNSPLKLE